MAIWSKIIILYGARQVGKSTLLNLVLLQKTMTNFTILNCENSTVSDVLSSNNLSRVKLLFGNAEIIALDEAQKIENIGLILKLIYDSNDFTCKPIILFYNF
ncbi:MAG: AAA family ATPase [Flavobacteriaceae bacterium]|nr:AAA family ATPase [Flavobacteriaceae bacterium]